MLANPVARTVDSHRAEPDVPGLPGGLTIARNIARTHSGGVTAALPGPGNGATFTLTIASPQLT